MSTEAKRSYNAATYNSHIYRIRKGCALDDRVSGYKACGGSMNWLITELLCRHFDVPMPHRYRFDRIVTPLVTVSDGRE